MSGWTWIIIAVAVGWVLQLGMAWRQARRFSAAVASLRKSTGGRVSVGMGKRRLRKAYVALAGDGTTVTRALVLRGVTTFAEAEPEPALAGQRLRDLAEGRVPDGLTAPVAAGATQAAAFLTGARSAAVPTGRRR
ncbi:MAG TPA: transcriptional regulator GutM [Mycobacteriales bacterium]